MDLLASNASSGMLAAGMLIVIFLLLRRSWRYSGKTNEQEPVTRRPLDDARQAAPLLDAPPEILRWQVEMHETARHLKGELDSKMSALQAMTRIASEESARLEAAIARAKQLGISPCVDTLVAIEELNSHEDSGSGLMSDTVPSKADEIAVRRAAIYQLADQGLAAGAIARSIGAPLGDVELLMSLRTNGASHDVR